MKRIILSLLFLLCAASGIQAQLLSTSIKETSLGQAWTITFTLGEADNYTALSLQMSLPEQIQAVDISVGSALQDTHQVLQGEVENGLLSIILYSPQSTLFANDGANFSIQLRSTENLNDTQHSLSLTDIRFADRQGMETKLTDQSVILQTGSVTGINKISTLPERKLFIYNAAGKLVRQAFCNGTTSLQDHTTNLGSGVYVVKCGSATFKFVKK